MAIVALTAGEPAGIGPELCVRIAQQAWPVPLVAIAAPELLRQRAQLLGLGLDLIPAGHGRPQRPAAAGSLYIHEVSLATPSQPGSLDRANSSYVIETLACAVDGCIGGSFDAMVTAPVHKAIINEAGIPFTGHTEFLAERSGGHPVMMLTCPGLRVALATTHLALREVAAAITPERVEKVLRVLIHDLNTRFGIGSPRILVCGLNPHAGEDGHLGREEIDTIAPTLDALDGPTVSQTIEGAELVFGAGGDRVGLGELKFIRSLKDDLTVAGGATLVFAHLRNVFFCRYCPTCGNKDCS